MSVHTIHVTSALTRSPHLEGSASSHRPRGAAVRPEGRRATHASEPPIHTLAAHTRGTDTARLPSRQLSSSPVHPLSTIIARHPCRKSPPSTSTQYNHLSSRSGWATNERLLRLHLRNRGAQTAPAPRAALPTRPRSTHGAPIQKRQLSGASAARDETSHACRSLRPAPNPELPERGRSGGLTPPPQAPRSGAETSAERRRTRPTLIS